LKSAFEGKLTEEWRENRDEIHSAKKLLEKIRKEKDQHYKLEVERSKRSGKKKPKKPATSKPINEISLPKVPSGWEWTRINDIAFKIQYGYTASSSNESIGPKMLRITDIQKGAVDWSSVPYCKIEDSKKDEYLLSKGDLVFARTGATVGKSFLIKGKFPEAVFASYLIRIVPTKLFELEYLYYFFQSSFYWKQIVEEQAGIGQPNVNGKKLSEIIFSCPSSEEQKVVVENLDKYMSIADNIEKEVETNLLQVKTLRNSVLSQAFQGQLVPQDPIDEPASKLLERIKAEKEAAQEVQKKTKKKRTSVKTRKKQRK